LHLDRVGHIQALDGSFSVENQHRDAAVAVQVDEPQARATPQLFAGIAARGESLFQSMASAGTASGRAAVAPAGTVGMASTRVPAIARACARAPFGSAVLESVIGC